MKALPTVDGGRWGGGAEGARLLDEQGAARVALARVLAAFEISDGADHRVDKLARVPVGVATLRVGEQRQVDGVQHVGRRAAISGEAPPRHRDSRVGAAVASVVERGHGDGVGAADRLRQKARDRDMRRFRKRDEGGSGECGRAVCGRAVCGRAGRARAIVVVGETASICQGVRERMHLREAEERDVVFERRAIVLGVFVLLGDRHSLCAVVLAVVCPPVSMAVYTYLHA